MLPHITSLFAQATNVVTGTGADAAATQPQAPFWLAVLPYALILAMIYFALIRPQSIAKKKQEEKLNTAKTGDKVVTSSGIHGVITNVKDNTVIVRVADNVKLEIEKTHLDKITRPDSDADKPAATKA